MSKIRLSKTEGKKQQDALARYSRFLPTLKLKKQQLQLELRDYRRRHDEAKDRRGKLLIAISNYAGLFNSPRALEVLGSLLTLKQVKRTGDNIAGVPIPVFGGVEFATKEYDLFLAPLWFDAALADMRSAVELREEVAILDDACSRLVQELKTTSQRVNLFEKVLIPECKANLRKIRIYLGDQDTSAVIRSKIAKKKAAEAAL